MYIVLFCENVLGCWLPYLDKVQIVYVGFGIVLYAAVMLLRFFRCQDFTKS